MCTTFAKILVPLDGSELAERALPCAERLARATGATVLLVRAVVARTLPGVSPIEAQFHAVCAAEVYLEQVAERLVGRGIATETALPYGEAAGWIVEEARLRGADLIVLSTHGRGGLGRLVYGSVAAAVLAEAPVPVLLVRALEPAAAPEPIGQPAAWPARPCVLVPLDGTPFAEEALPVAAALGEALDGELVLHRAVPYPPALMTPEAVLAATLEEDLDRDRAAAEDYLIHRAGPVVRTGRPARIDVRIGMPADTIVAAAAEHHAAFTVMATHGRGGLGRALLGSVADTVLRRGATPLLLVRPRASGGETVEAVEDAAEAIEAAPGPRLVLELDQDEVVLLRRALQTFAEAVAAAPGPGQLPARTARLLARLAGEEGAPSAPAPAPSLAGVA